MKHLRVVVPALSLVLAIIVAWLWVRSYRPIEDYIVWRGETTTWIAHSKRGRIWFEHWRGAVPVPTRPASWDVVWTMQGTTNAASGEPIDVGFSPAPPAPGNGFGFVWFQTDQLPCPDGQRIGTLKSLAIPHWPIVAGAMIAPTVWAVRWLRRRRHERRGLCPRCGYDLRATPGRCPECGWANDAPEPAATVGS